MRVRVRVRARVRIIRAIFSKPTCAMAAAIRLSFLSGSFLMFTCWMGAWIGADRLKVSGTWVS